MPRLAAKKGARLLIGFAAETDDLEANARGKLKRKGLDLIVANDVTREGAGFEVDTNIVTLIGADGRSQSHPQMSKDAVADLILDRIVAIRAGKPNSGRAENFTAARRQIVARHKREKDVCGSSPRTAARWSQRFATTSTVARRGDGRTCQQSRRHASAPGAVRQHPGGASPQYRARPAPRLMAVELFREISGTREDSATLEAVARVHRRLPAMQARTASHQSRVRRRQSQRGADVRLARLPAPTRTLAASRSSAAPVSC